MGMRAQARRVAQSHTSWVNMSSFCTQSGVILLTTTQHSNKMAIRMVWTMCKYHSCHERVSCLLSHGVSWVQDAIRCSIRISNVNTCSNALPHQNLYRQTLICQDLIVGCNLGVNHICNKLLNSWVLPWVQIIKKAKYVKLFAKLSKLFWCFDVAYCEYLYYKILLLKTCHSKGSLEYE